MRSCRALLPLALFVAPGCGGCGDSSASLSEEGSRLWGHELQAARWTEAAEAPLDPRSLDRDVEARRRVLDMPVEEVVARLGFLRYQGVARFQLERNGHHLDVFEDTTLEHGLGGSWRVVQRDQDGKLLREKVYANGLYYFRNGPGKLRAQGVADRPGTLARAEAFAPLSDFTSWFGDQLRLDRAGTSSHEGRNALEYTFALDGGGGLVADPHHPDRRLRPERLNGRLYVDEATGAPLRAKLRGTLGVEPPPGSRAWGKLEVALDFRIHPGAGRAIDVGEHIPSIAHRPVDLDPLGFLKGKTRTSTVIGGGGR